MQRHVSSSSRLTISLLAVAALAIGVSVIPGGREALARWRAANMVAPVMSPGDTTILFGPHVFSTPSGSSTISIETFTATPVAGQRYSVIMQKGSGSLTTADVLFNGLQIASVTDFPSTTPVSRVVNLLTSDTVKVTLAGSAGATLTVTVIADPDPNFAIYGVQRFVKQGSGNSSVQFTRPAAASAPYFLSVVNGPPGSGGRVSSGTIKIDNVDVATSSDFNQNVAGFVKEISLSSGQHTLTVSLGGSNGKAIDLLITARDTTPPVITLTAPQQNAITSATSVSVTGTVTDQTVTTVTLNGAAATMTGTSFSGSVPLATEGNNTITVRARDGAFLTTDSVRTVIRDTQAPSLTVSSPVDGLTTNQAQLTVAGTVSDLTTVTVNVNGIPATVTAGAFSTSLTLTSGLNIVTVSATDAASNVTSIVRQVTLDTQAPSLTVTAPVDQATTGEATITVTGTVSDATAVTVVANSVSLTVAPNGSFSGAVPLVIGSNTITTVATDAAGNFTSIPRVVIREQGEEIGGPLPIDNSLNAPALDQSQSVSFLDATAFLYTGANPVQTGVTAGTILYQSAAVVRGRVLSRGGVPIAGVTVSIAGHTEFGSTTTRSNGLFDMVVNGGGHLRVAFAKTGYLPVERQVLVPWGQYTVVDDVIQIPLDAQGTTIDFTDPVEVAAGGVVSDSRGTRQAVAMFEQGTTATLQLPNGSTQPVSSITVRATEFTVGPSGTNAMPGLLPTTSAYTYAVEMSADEAIAAGATSVTFSKPVAIYVDNFIGFRTGIAMPVGYFDRKRGVWVPSADGRVIKIVGVTAGKADIAVDTTEVAATDSVLTALGFTTAEREDLATRYAVGKTLWRAEVGHFTPFDFNLFNRFNFDPTDPKNRPDPDPDGPDRESCKASGSIIGCEARTLGETIDLPGSGGQALHYQSERTRGYTARQRVRWRLLGDTVPTRLDSIIVTVTVAGRFFTWRYPRSALGPRFTFRTDLGSMLQGVDAYGRPLPSGTIRAQGKVRYVLLADYVATPPQPTRTFALGPQADLIQIACDTTLAGCRPRMDVTYDVQETVQTLDARATYGLGGWSLTAHHAMDVVGQELLFGNGSFKTINDAGVVSRTVTGNGVAAYTGDGGPATAASILETLSIAVNGEGSLFLGGYWSNRIRRVSPSGIISAFGPQLPRPERLSVGPDGSLYVVTESHVVFRMDPVTGDTTTFAGSGLDFTTDGIDAKQARFFNVFGIAAAPDGSVYIHNSSTGRVRRVMPDGRIYTVAGNGVSCGLGAGGGDGQPATTVKLCDVRGISVTPSGDLYILDHEWAALVLRKVGTDGIMRTVVGNQFVCPNDSAPCGDNGPASLAGLSQSTNSVSATPQGYILLTNNERVRIIDQDGVISTVFGLSSPAFSYSGDHSPTLQTVFNRAADAEMGPDGKLYVLDQLGYRVVRGMPPFSVLATQNIKVASEDGQEAYVFSPAGRHLQTIDVLTNTVLLTFGYDAAGRLLTVTDVDGNVTTVQRDGTGKPLAIVGPFGQTNSLTLDANGYLATVTNPKNEVTQAQHGSSGLLATLTDPRGGPPHEFTYGESGWLTRDEDQTGGFKELTRTETDSGFKVALTTGLGRVRSYEMAFVADGSVRRNITDPAGLITRSIEGADKTVTIKSPTGDSIRTTLGPDSRFSMQSPVAKSFSIRMPSGLEATGRQVRTGTLSNPDDPFSLVTLRDSLIFNGRIATSVYDAATRTRTSTSPQGRQSVTKLDATGRVIEERITGVAPVKYNYGQRGFLTSVTQAGRVLQYDYDSTGRVKKVTDPLGRTEQFLYDSAGRVVTQTLPDGRQILYGYDANGNLTSLTPPTKPAHTFNFNAANQDSIYSPPAAGLSSFKTNYSYNLDRQLTQILRPDSQTIGIAYDTAGRPSVITVPNGTSTFGYSPTTGLLTSLTSLTGGSLAFTYDGSLPKTATWSGTVAGSVGLNYDASFRVTSITVNGANSIALGYDNDDLLTSAGSLTLSRDAQNGRLTGTTLASMITAHAYDDSIGTLKRSTARFSNDTLLDFQYTRDTLDRITQLIERVQGTTQTWDYAYDSIGRLDQVRLGGVLVSDYTYDGNGNRLGLTTQSGSVTGTVDDQDRLLTWGTNSYSYTSNGELKRKVSGTDTTRFTYDVLGNLLQVQLPNATTIDYLVDGQNRRIGRKVNGVLTQGFLYQGQLSPIAELNGSNQVVSRFVYGTHVNVPEYVIKSGTTYRILTDHLGSVRLVVNTTNGTIAQRIDYDEYGRVTQNTSPGFQPFGFAGGLYDDATKLVRFGARDYDAETGRWTAKDPIKFEGGSSNLYAYVLEDPVNLTDANGLQPTSVDAAIRACNSLPTAAQREACLKNLFDTVEGTGSAEQVRKALDGQRRLMKKASDLLKECLGSVRREFPSQFEDYTLEQIQRLAKAGDRAAKKAYKLLNDPRFKKP